MTRNFTPPQKSAIDRRQPFPQLGMAGVMKMRLLHLTLALAFLTAPSAFGQSMPSWKSATQTGNVRDLVQSAGNDNSVAAWLGKKVDVSSINRPNGVAGLDHDKNLIANTFSNFAAVSGKSYQSLENQMRLPTNTVTCPGITGPNGRSGACTTLLNDGSIFNTTSGPVGSNINVVQLDNAVGASVGQFIGTINYSTTQPLWAFNIVMNQAQNAAFESGIELDMNRSITGCSVPLDVDVGAANGCSSMTGFWATGINASGTTGGAAYYATMSGTGTHAPLWADGFAAEANSIRDTVFLDNTAAPTTLKALNGHYAGIDFSNAKFWNSAIMLADIGSSTPNLPTTQGMFWTTTPTTTITGDPKFTASISGGGGAGALFFDSNNSFYFNVDKTTTTDFEIGSQKTMKDLVIDEHTSGISNDYDERLYFSGGLGAGSITAIAPAHITAATSVFQVYNTSTSSADTTDVEIGSTTTAQSSALNFHTSGSSNTYDAQIASSGGDGRSGNNGQGNLALTASRISINGVLNIQRLTKTQILGISSPVEGTIVNDSDDHVPVVYENGHWYPMTLGPALQ